MFGFAKISSTATALLGAPFASSGRLAPGCPPAADPGPAPALAAAASLSCGAVAHTRQLVQPSRSAAARLGARSATRRTICATAAAVFSASSSWL